MLSIMFALVFTIICPITHNPRFKNIPLNRTNFCKIILEIALRDYNAKKAYA